jgi:hypothetical protein
MQQHMDHEPPDRFPTDPSGLPEAGRRCWSWPTATPGTWGSGHHRALARAAPREQVRRGATRDQAPIPVGGEFTYRIQFPDPGLYWYHPHIREDYTQELGLYGNILVIPSDPDDWAPADRDIVLTLDGKVAPFSPVETSYAAMGRFGNVF